MKPYGLPVTKEITLVPIIHYSIQSATSIRTLLQDLRPDAIAVEFPKECKASITRAIARMPDISAIRILENRTKQVRYIPIEPCDPLIEAFRTALERDIPLHCIDSIELEYPQFKEPILDPYVIEEIGLQRYIEFSLFQPESHRPIRSIYDDLREMTMAQNIFELSIREGSVIACVGMQHLYPIAQKIQTKNFINKSDNHAPEKQWDIDLITYPEKNASSLMKNSGYISMAYETWRENFPLKNLNTIFLYSDLIEDAIKSHIPIESSRLRMIGKTINYMKRLSRIRNGIFGETQELIEAVRGMISQRAGYLVWKKISEYPFIKNIDALEEVDLSPKELWGNEIHFHFHPITPSHKGLSYERAKELESNNRSIFYPSNSICSYPPEDSVVEQFGHTITQYAVENISEEATQTYAFTTSLEDGVNIRETIRHRIGWKNSGLYVDKRKPFSGQIGSSIVIFHEDEANESEETNIQPYPWTMTWHGEHHQESDMAFYATYPLKGIIGPGIARCTYGGFLLSYPPQRLLNIWEDPAYRDTFSTRQEILLAAGIDYSTEPLIVYTSAKPPSKALQEYATMQGKRVCYIPIGRFSKKKLRKLKTFHVLDSKERRELVGEYIDDILFDDIT